MPFPAVASTETSSLPGGPFGRDILADHFPDHCDGDFLARAIAVYMKLRETKGLTRTPGTAELIDWVGALTRVFPSEYAISEVRRFSNAFGSGSPVRWMDLLLSCLVKMHETRSSRRSLGMAREQEGRATRQATSPGFLSAVEREVNPLSGRDHLDVRRWVRSRPQGTPDDLREALAALLATDKEQLERVQRLFELHVMARRTAGPPMPERWRRRSRSRAGWERDMPVDGAVRGQLTSWERLRWPSSPLSSASSSSRSDPLTCPLLKATAAAKRGPAKDGPAKDGPAKEGVGRDPNIIEFAHAVHDYQHPGSRRASTQSIAWPSRSGPRVPRARGAMVDAPGGGAPAAEATDRRARRAGPRGATPAGRQRPPREATRSASRTMSRRICRFGDRVWTMPQSC